MPATDDREMLQAPLDAVCIKRLQFFLPELWHPGYRRSLRSPYEPMVWSVPDDSGTQVRLPAPAIVWAVGESGPAGSFNPLVLQNG